jgi:hypothetical protein
MLLRIDTNGSLLWGTYFGRNYSNIFEISAKVENKLWIVGDTNSKFVSGLPSSHQKDIFSNGLTGYVSCFLLENPMKEDGSFKLFPNPTASAFTINTIEKYVGAEYEIYNLFGRLIMNGHLSYWMSEVDVSRLIGGVYFFSLPSVSKKMVKFVKE